MERSAEIITALMGHLFSKPHSNGRENRREQNNADSGTSDSKTETSKSSDTSDSSDSDTSSSSSDTSSSSSSSDTSSSSSASDTSSSSSSSDTSGSSDSDSTDSDTSEISEPVICSERPTVPRPTVPGSSDVPNFQDPAFLEAILNARSMSRFYTFLSDMVKKYSSNGDIEKLRIVFKEEDITPFEIPDRMCEFFLVGPHWMLNDFYPGREGIAEICPCPPNSAYEDTPYSSIPERDRPCMLVPYHMNQAIASSTDSNFLRDALRTPGGFFAALHCEIWNKLRLCLSLYLSWPKNHSEPRYDPIPSLMALIAYCRESPLYLNAPVVPRGHLISKKDSKTLKKCFKKWGKEVTSIYKVVPVIGFPGILASTIEDTFPYSAPKTNRQPHQPDES